MNTLLYLALCEVFYGFARIPGHRGRVLQSKVALRVQRHKTGLQRASTGKDIKTDVSFIYRKGDQKMNIKRKPSRTKSKRPEDP